MDDFPHGKPNYNQDYKNIVYKWLKIFEDENINYIFGVTPFLLTFDDINFLNNYVKNGKIVMHGFNHKFDFQGDWNNIVNTWKNGGEFENMNEELIEERYLKAHKILNQLSTYDKDHFIPPFNCFNQQLINILDKYSIKYLHTCDKEYDSYGYSKLNYKNIQPIISEYHIGYDFCNKVFNRLGTFDSQITFHWIFDSELNGWENHYKIFCREIKKYENFNYTGSW